MTDWVGQLGGGDSLSTESLAVRGAVPASIAGSIGGAVAGTLLGAWAGAAPACGTAGALVGGAVAAVAWWAGATLVGSLAARVRAVPPRSQKTRGAVSTDAA